MLQNPNAVTVGVFIALVTVTWLMLDGFRKDLKGDIAEAEVRLTESLPGIEVRLTKEIAAVKSRLSADIKETGHRLDGRLSRTEHRLDRIIEVLLGGPGASLVKEGLR